MPPGSGVFVGSHNLRAVGTPQTPETPALALLRSVLRAMVLLTCVLVTTTVVLVALTGRDTAIVPLTGVITALFATVALLARLAFGWLSRHEASDGEEPRLGRELR